MIGPQLVLCDISVGIWMNTFFLQNDHDNINGDDTDNNIDSNYYIYNGNDNNDNNDEADYVVGNDNNDNDNNITVIKTLTVPVTMTEILNRLPKQCHIEVDCLVCQCKYTTGDDPVEFQGNAKSRFVKNVVLFCAI